MGQKKLTIAMAILAALALGVGTAFAAIIVPNGDFSAGNTNFTVPTLTTLYPV